MRIVGSRLERIGGGRCAPFGRSRAETREGWLLTLHADDGRDGIGEATPLPGYSAETFAEAGGLLEGIHLSIAGLHLDRAPIAAVERAISPVTKLLAAAPSARFALETA